MNQKVSVITVCYNAEEFIEQAINSVLDQTYENIEYLIIDGNSSDNTVSIINKYKDKIHYFLSEPDKGIYEAMNKGIKAASGDILYFLNSDDIFYDKYVVENIVKMFKLNDEIELLYGPILIKDSFTNESFVKTHENISKSFFIYDTICHQGIFFKADTFKKCGLFDDTYKIVGDYEWLLRAFYKYDIKRKYYRSVIAIFRFGGMSCSKEFSELHAKEWRRAFNKYFNKFEFYKYMFILLIKKILIRPKRILNYQ
ncbi:MAG: glycosyltransferase family 2 protein [Candidatus Methanoperedens sp.]|nr:glycosyltransferase family 2 protein [Candidatus Methanoperedens sp.]